VFLQETWLASDELCILNDIHGEFYGKGTSAIDVSSGTLTGRPHGGVAILWRKSICNTKIIYLHDPRLLGIELTYNAQKLAFLNVYLPVDNSQNTDDFLFYMTKIGEFIDSHTTPYAAVFGDFNTNLLQNSNSVFKRHLLQICLENNLVVADQRLCSSSTFTFYSEAHHSVSWLDHFITNINMLSCVKHISVDYKFVSSGHFPMCVELDLSVARTEIKQANENGNHDGRSDHIRWDKLKQSELSMYENATDLALKKVKLPHSLLLCDDIHCTDVQHTQQIDLMYKSITESLHEAGLFLVEQCDKYRDNEIPGWNDYCKQVHAEAREAFLIWIDNGRPRAGPLFKLMSTTRSKFKLALRQCKYDKTKIKADKLAERLINKNTNEFWKEIKKITKKSSTIASSVGLANTEADFAQLWISHYESLLNSTPVSPFEKASTINKVRSGVKLEKVQPTDLVKAVQKLKVGKSKGIDGLKNEHYKYASNRLYALLALCFNAMLIHGHMCSDMMKTVILPIVKDKNEDLSSVDNYRPIAYAINVVRLK
jgi:exonuclease III